MDTGDKVRRKISGVYEIVSCVHPPIVYLIGYPPTPVRLDELELIEEATDTARQALLEDIAKSSGNGHRPRCARERIAAARGES